MSEHPEDFVSAQRAFQDAVEKKRRLEETRPADLPGTDGAQSAATQAWRERMAEVESDIARARAALDGGLAEPG